VENQVDIMDMMQYYLGEKGRVQGEGLLYVKITEFPRYLAIVFKRFSANDYNVEKNSSQVLYSGCLEIEGLVYRLVGQVCHQGNSESGSYKAAVCFG
jgi:ubiquitin C-terminal hydrolase